MEIKILGTGCPKCNRLEKMTREVVAEKGLEASIEKVTDLNRIAAAGVMLTPALVIDGEVKLTGKVPSRQELAALIGGS